MAGVGVARKQWPPKPIRESYLAMAALQAQTKLFTQYAEEGHIIRMTAIRAQPRNLLAVDGDLKVFIAADQQAVLDPDGWDAAALSLATEPTPCCYEADDYITLYAQNRNVAAQGLAVTAMFEQVRKDRADKDFARKPIKTSYASYASGMSINPENASPPLVALDQKAQKNHFLRLTGIKAISPDLFAIEDSVRVFLRADNGSFLDPQGWTAAGISNAAAHVLPCNYEADRQMEILVANTGAVAREIFILATFEQVPIG